MKPTEMKCEYVLSTFFQIRTKYENTEWCVLNIKRDKNVKVRKYFLLRK